MAEYIEKWAVVNRLIDLENEFQQYKPFHGFEHAMYRKVCEAEIAIGKTSAVDVAPVVHGRWLDGKCTNCTWETPDSVNYTGYEDEAGILTNYCPNCGARMDGD